MLQSVSGSYPIRPHSNGFAFNPPGALHTLFVFFFSHPQGLSDKVTSTIPRRDIVDGCTSTGSCPFRPQETHHLLLVEPHRCCSTNRTSHCSWARVTRTRSAHSFFFLILMRCKRRTIIVACFFVISPHLSAYDSKSLEQIWSASRCNKELADNSPPQKQVE